MHVHRGNAFAPNVFHVSEEKVHHEEPKSKNKIVGIFEGCITFCIVALFAGLPIFFTGQAYQGISFEKQVYFYVWILLALVAWATKSVIAGEMQLRRTPLDIPIALFLFFYGVATIFSIDRWHSFWGYFGDPSRGLMNVIAIVVAYYIVVNHFSKRRFFIAAWVFAGANFVSVTWTLAQVLGLKFPEKIALFLPMSVTGSLTGLGILLGAMIPLLMTLMFSVSENSDKKNKFRIAFTQGFLFLLILLNLFSLLTIYNYVSWLGVLVGSSFFLVYVLAQIVRPRANVTWVPMIVFVMILVILMIGANSIARTQLPVEITPSYAMSWEIAKKSLKESFFAGSGPATYWYDFSKFKPQEFNVNPYYNLRFYQGSGIFFESLSTLGIAGVVLLLLIVVTYVSVGVYLLSIDKKKNKILSLGLYASSLVFLINAFAGKIEGAIIALGILTAALAIAMLHVESDTEERVINLSLKASPKFALSLAFLFMVISAGVVFLFVFIGKAYVADITVGKAAVLPTTKVEEAMQKTANAIRLNPRENRYYTFFSQQALIVANTEALKADKERDVNKIQQSLNDAIFSVNQAKELSKNDVTVIEVAGQIYENSSLYVADSAAFAEENYKRALELEPENAVFYLKLGQMKLTQAANVKEEEKMKALVGEAKSLFEKAIEKKKDLAEAYNQLSIAKDSLVDLDGSIAASEQALIIDRNNGNYKFSLARLYQARGKDDDVKAAELLYKEILSQNDKEINTHFALGSLYEKTKKWDDAKVEYRKVAELVPDDNDALKKQLEKMISNVERGIQNTAENLGLLSTPDASQTVEASPQATPEVSQ